MCDGREGDLWTWYALFGVCASRPSPCSWCCAGRLLWLRCLRGRCRVRAGVGVGDVGCGVAVYLAAEVDGMACDAMAVRDFVRL